MVMVDDSHAVGFIGPTGRGTPEHCGVMDRVDIVTGTLGKALGGASGGYVSGRKEIVDLLRQRSRPYLFSNTLAPPIVAASLRVLELLERGEAAARAAARQHRALPPRDRRPRLQGPARRPPDRPGHVRRCDPLRRVADRLLDEGVYVVAFSYPVVPMGAARIRTQMSAAHDEEDLRRAIDAFASVR